MGLDNQYQKSMDTPAKTASVNKFAEKSGKVHDEIGSGDEAKSGIVWKSIHFSFLIGIGLSIAVILFFIISLFSNEHSKLTFPIDYLKDIWAIFIPIITLALGYIFGKGDK
jgi:hypothetical protein